LPIHLSLSPAERRTGKTKDGGRKREKPFCPESGKGRKKKTKKKGSGLLPSGQENKKKAKRERYETEERGADGPVTPLLRGEKNIRLSGHAWREKEGKEMLRKTERKRNAPLQIDCYTGRKEEEEALLLLCGKKGIRKARGNVKKRWDGKEGRLNSPLGK